MSNQTQDILKINRPTSASILQEFMEKINQRFDELEKQQQATSLTEPPAWDETELGKQLKDLYERLASLSQLHTDVENQRDAILQIQNALEALKPLSAEDLSSKLEKALESKIQQVVQAELVGQQATLQKLQTTLDNLNPPSATEIASTLSGQLEALENGLNNRQDGLIQGQANLHQQQEDLTGIVTGLEATVGALKQELLAATQKQFNDFQTSVDQRINEATAEFRKQLEPIQAAQAAIETATERLNAVSVDLTAEFDSLKDTLQGEVSALKERQEVLQETTESLSESVGALDERVLQITQSVQSLENTAKELETFAEETLLPELRTQLESTLEALKSDQVAHQTTMSQTLSDLRQEVDRTQQTNDRLQTIESKTEDTLQYLRIITPSLPDEWREAYSQAIEQIVAFEQDGNGNRLDQAEELLAFRNHNLYSPRYYPLFAAAVENALARLWHNRQKGRSKAGNDHAEEARFILQIYYNTRIPEGKNLREKIMINRDWIDKNPLTPLITSMT